MEYYQTKSQEKHYHVANQYICKCMQRMDKWSDIFSVQKVSRFLVI